MSSEKLVLDFDESRAQEEPAGQFKAGGKLFALRRPTLAELAKLDEMRDPDDSPEGIEVLRFAFEVLCGPEHVEELMGLLRPDEAGRLIEAAIREAMTVKKKG